MVLALTVAPVPVPVPVPESVVVLGFLVKYGLGFCFESLVDLTSLGFNVVVVVRLAEMRMRNQTMEMNVMPIDATITTLVLERVSWQKVDAQLRSDCDDGVTTGNVPPAGGRDGGEDGVCCLCLFPSFSVRNGESRWNQAPRVSMAEAVSAGESQSGMHDDTVHCEWDGKGSDVRRQKGISKSRSTH